MNLRQKTPSELLALYRQILRELKEQGVIRSNNAPVGDYAEFLVRQATNGHLADVSEKGWDVRAGKEKLQVKARVITGSRRKSERQLSSFRSWNFDAAIIVLLDGNLRVTQAARIPVRVLEAEAR